ncbi:MAG TPA: tetratricopeptide repeat protein [Candidatus Sulfotelmatobacter sp.]|nr:tetratricopeptide repeat protein [Candidatus Sulfotelmatobacter sp.]
MRKPTNKRFLLPLILTLATLPLLAAAQQSHKTPPTPAAAQKTPPPASGPATATIPGNEVCQKCHSEIAASYAQTAMARASGQAIDQLTPADFTHPASGVHYRVYAENNAAMLAFDRPDDPAMHGTRRLQYFIGSGHRGRTYLFSLDGFFFESPINWYAQKKVWDTAPAFQQSRIMPMNLAAFPGCLNCHTSGSRAPITGTENKYDMPLFVHDGISCERCHGDNAAHIATGKGDIVNPAKLAPARRDEICMQCHLEGNVAIEQPHHKLADYRPGADLGDEVHYYIYVDQESQQIRALGQSEALWQSVCKLKSGDKMTCITCHDPHSTPAPERRVAFYRAKCLTCHGDAFAATHHLDQPDCTSCHMPRTTTSNVAHTQATDHRILKLPMMPLQGLQTGAPAQLIRFPAPATGASTAEESAATAPSAPPTTNASAGDARDLALAWESIAQEGHASAAIDAERYLNQAIVEHPNDPVLLDSLAYLAQRRGDTAKARELYEHALQADPLMIDAAANLGVIEAHDGHFDRAAALWDDAFKRAPGRSAIGMNLAHISCDTGQFDKARAYVARVLQFNPDSPSAKNFAKQLAADPPNCKSR